MERDTHALNAGARRQRPFRSLVLVRTTRRGPAWAPGWPTGLARPPARAGAVVRNHTGGGSGSGSAFSSRALYRHRLAAAINQPAGGGTGRGRGRARQSGGSPIHFARLAGWAGLLAGQCGHASGSWLLDKCIFFPLPFSALPSCFSRSTRRGWLPKVAGPRSTPTSPNSADRDKRTGRVAALPFTDSANHTVAFHVRVLKEANLSRSRPNSTQRR
jgi:hypothetical protein